MRNNVRSKKTGRCRHGDDSQNRMVFCPCHRDGGVDGRVGGLPGGGRGGGGGPPPPAGGGGWWGGRSCFFCPSSSGSSGEEGFLPVKKRVPPFGPPRVGGGRLFENGVL